MMRRNIHFNILLLLLLVEAMSVHAVAQIPDSTLYQSISLDEYPTDNTKINLYNGLKIYSRVVLPV